MERGKTGTNTGTPAANAASRKMGNTPVSQRGGREYEESRERKARREPDQVRSEDQRLCCTHLFSLTSEFVMAKNRRYPPAHPKSQKQSEQGDTWEPFEPVADTPDNYSTMAVLVGVSGEALQQEMPRPGCTRQRFRNNKYTVVIETLSPRGLSGELHLSVTRNDRSAAHDWREFQRIKNELCGPEREAVELYPSQSRLCDTANTFHLWVMAEGDRVPVGWHASQTVLDSDVASQLNIKQRPFGDDDPARELCLTKESYGELLKERRRHDDLRGGADPATPAPPVAPPSGS